MKDWHGDKTELKEGLKEGEKQTNKEKKKQEDEESGPHLERKQGAYFQLMF